MKKQERYTSEFRAEAVKGVFEQARSQEAASKRRGIPKGTLVNGVVSARASARGGALGARSAAALEAENARWRQELAETRRERESVKKATAYFARESLPGTRA